MIGRSLTDMPTFGIALIDEARKWPVSVKMALL
jgi:hypothetical protein